MTAAPHPELDARFRAEVRTSTRATGIVAGAVAVVALPAWMGFDYIVEPDHASTFALLRLIALGPMLVCLGALFTGSDVVARSCWCWPSSRRWRSRSRS